MVPPAGQSGPAPPNPQLTQQFLSSVLSQRGPSALPYSEDTKWLIRQHLVSLITAYPSLEPKTATYTHNDGRTDNLLQADGTIPMSFQGLTYNIPVVIWLMESYPRHPPCAIVNPTRDMIIKRPHPHVNPSGLVSIPYLQNWVYPSSNLVDLVRNLSHLFGRDPPLYSQRRPNSNPSPNPSSIPSSSSNPNPIAASSYGVNPYARMSIPSRAYPLSPYGSSGSLSRVHQTDDPNEVFKRNAINKLVEMVRIDVAVMRKAEESEMDGVFNVQKILRHREERIYKGLKEMRNEKEGLEHQLQMVLMNSDLIEAWLKENEGKMGNLDGLDVDDAIECVDATSKQILECTASDLAIEDVIYYLDKAVQEGHIPFDQYLRNVRLLSREQFFHRATVIKVKAAQMEVQVANMASRISHYVST